MAVDRKMSTLYLQALKHNDMSETVKKTEILAASNIASASPRNRKRKTDRNDLAETAATQPSDEVMNALFEQVTVRA